MFEADEPFVEHDSRDLEEVNATVFDGIARFEQCPYLRPNDACLAKMETGAENTSCDYAVSHEARKGRDLLGHPINDKLSWISYSHPEELAGCSLRAGKLLESKFISQAEAHLNC